MLKYLLGIDGIDLNVEDCSGQTAKLVAAADVKVQYSIINHVYLITR